MTDPETSAQVQKLWEIAQVLGYTEACTWIAEHQALAEDAIDKLIIAEVMSPINVLCSHVDNRGMSCVRRAGHLQRHKYSLSDEEAKARAGQISQERLAAARSNQTALDCMKVGKYTVCVGDAVSLAPSESNDHRGWLGVLKELYAKDGTDYAVVLGRKGSKHAQIKEKIIRAERIEYIRPGTEKARQAKIRAGRAV